LITTKALTVTF